MDIFKFFYSRIRKDNILLEAATLSFTTVLALVPAATVVLSIFTMVPAFKPMQDTIKEFAATNFVPVFSNSVSTHLDEFTQKAGSLTMTGIVVLFVISLLLVRSIDKSINRIFRGGKRSLSMTFAIYWALLTLGPLALGITLTISSKLIALSLSPDSYDLGMGAALLYYITPVAIEIALFLAIYMVVPAIKIRFRDALLTALIITIIYELVKKLFSFFIINYSAYASIYGAIAAIPVLMIWIHINWILTLIGAEFCASLHIVRKGNSDSIPKLLVSIAAATGDIGGSSMAHKVVRIKVKTQNEDGEEQTS